MFALPTCTVDGVCRLEGELLRVLDVTRNIHCVSVFNLLDLTLTLDR